MLSAISDTGLAAEAEVLADELRAVGLPCVAVFGNHDHESGSAGDVRRILVDAGVQVLEGDACEIEAIGFAGAKASPTDSAAARSDDLPIRVFEINVGDDATPRDERGSRSKRRCRSTRVRSRGEAVRSSGLFDQTKLLDIGSGWRESNPHLKDGSLARCHYDTPARLPPDEAAIPVTVRTNDIALRDLREQRRDRDASRHPRHEPLLLGTIPMIEFHRADWIALSAIHARHRLSDTDEDIHLLAPSLMPRRAMLCCLG